ncbi:CMP-N-acetylneuraminate-poly-alpha-2,8-sialyltransferase-like [Saccoglossus kowalevskii]|uniref:Alpha-2,8-sialyltransferase 8B-like n=1 Tax=Saccoglossus kowalevskii TaxID=10224 RepID=A0ABM0MWG1_SACKO|nr:PREDICTED: alpha-2,8-sialyltransferase 8B-like [Saccoglossus kowalevskii]
MRCKNDARLFYGQSAAIRTKAMYTGDFIEQQQTINSFTNITGNEKQTENATKPLLIGDIMKIRKNTKQKGRTKNTLQNGTQVFNLFARGNPFSIIEENKNVKLIPRQKTCAVVGNSGILLNSSCGDEINSNDFVIRCNIPEIEGFSRDVGNKTNVTNINLTRVQDIYKYAKEDSDSPYLIDNFRYLNNTILWTLGSHRTRRPKRLVYSVKYLKSKFDLNFQVAYTEGKQNYTEILSAMKFKKSPTAGMLTIGVAVCLCDKVSVYGFYPFPAGPDGRFVPYHYFGEFTNITAGSFKTRHGYNQEYLILQKWHQEGLINFVSGSCTKV